MADILSKIKKGVSYVGDLSTEAIESAKTKVKVGKLTEQKKEALLMLGEKLYEMHKNDYFDKGLYEKYCSTILDIDKEIDACLNEKQKVNYDEIRCQCGAVLKSGSKFCSSCGCKVEEISPRKVMCECGEEIALNSKFCNNCGKSIVGLETMNIQKVTQTGMSTDLSNESATVTLNCLCGASWGKDVSICKRCGRKLA